MRILPVDLNKDFNEAILESCRVLRASGTMIYPTDTAYSLGANACDSVAVEKVFQIKNRHHSKPLPVLVRNLAWAKELAYITPRQEKYLTSNWPGQVTVILPRREHLSALTTANGMTVGLRVANSPFLDKLLAKLGYPLTATSANLSGLHSARGFGPLRPGSSEASKASEEAGNDINKVVAELETSNRPFGQAQGRQPNLVIDAGILSKSPPSTVLDLTSEEPKILRVGPTSPELLRRLLGMK